MQLTKELFQKLKDSVAFFANFTDGEFLALLKLTQRETFDDGEIIFKENTRGDKMYIIMSGTVRISKYLGKDKEGKPQEEVLAKLGPGACFGEMGIIDQSPRSARATIEGGEAIILSIRETVLKQSNLLLAYKLYKNFSVMLAQRLRSTNEKLSEASSEDRSASAKLKEMVKSRLEKGHSLQGVNLKGADLQGIFFQNANFENSIFIGANMQNTKCKQANFTKAKLINAKLDGAEFNNANLQGADFTGANFENTQFIGCNLASCNFQGAELTKANMEQLHLDTKKQTK